MRSQNEAYSDDVSWATALSQASLTPETLRDQVIESLQQDIIIRQAAAEKELVVDPETVEQQVTQAKETVGGDDATWEEALKKYGYQNEDDLRARLEISDLQKQLTEVLSAEPDEEGLNEYLKQYAGQYAGRRSSAIVLNAGDGTTVEEQKAKAEEVAAKLAEGDDFTALVAEYSTDSTSKENEGDMGWSSLAQQSQAYQDALDALELNKISDPVEDTSAVYIIKCTGIFEPSTEEGAELDLSTIPDDIKETLQSQFEQSNKSTVYQKFIDQMMEDATVEKNDMPADVPYNVDMSLAESTSSSTDDSTDADADASDSSSSAADEYVDPINEAEITGSLVIVDTLEGSGEEAKAGDTVNVIYTGYLADGKVFDSTERNGGTPFTFTLGEGRVIQGWEQGLLGMKVGGKRHLVIPADLAYGEAGSGTTIPPNSTLAFEVELVSISSGTSPESDSSEPADQDSTNQ
jgi:FKBP-type peptidyl-prolyl cis-trans isomerase